MNNHIKENEFFKNDCGACNVCQNASKCDNNNNYQSQSFIYSFQNNSNYIPGTFMSEDSGYFPELLLQNVTHKDFHN
jgi:hypothetical protein